MIGVIATLRVRDGKNAEFEKVFADLTAKVKANESGTLVYQLTRSRADPNTYKVLELYASPEAMKAHGSSDYFRAAGPSFAAVLAGPPEIEHLDAVD